MCATYLTACMQKCAGVYSFELLCQLSIYHTHCKLSSESCFFQEILAGNWQTIYCSLGQSCDVFQCDSKVSICAYVYIACDMSPWDKPQNFHIFSSDTFWETREFLIRQHQETHSQSCALTDSLHYSPIRIELHSNQIFLSANRKWV